MNTSNFNGFAQTTTSSGTINGPFTTSSYPTYIMFHVFENLSKTFNLELEQGQIEFLDQLYDSADEQNKILACEMFKHMLAKQLK